MNIDVVCKSLDSNHKVLPCILSFHNFKLSRLNFWNYCLRSARRKYLNTQQRKRQKLFVEVTLCYAQWIAFRVHLVQPRVLCHTATQKGKLWIAAFFARIHGGIREENNDWVKKVFFSAIVVCFVALKFCFFFMLPLSVRPQISAPWKRLTLKKATRKNDEWHISSF